MFSSISWLLTFFPPHCTWMERKTSIPNSISASLIIPFFSSIFPSLPCSFPLCFLNLVINGDSSDHHLFWKSSTVKNVWVVIWPTLGSGSVFVSAVLIFLFCVLGQRKKCHSYLLSLLLLSQARRHSKKIHLWVAPSACWEKQGERKRILGFQRLYQLFCGAKKHAPE